MSTMPDCGCPCEQAQRDRERQEVTRLRAEVERLTARGEQAEREAVEREGREAWQRGYDAGRDHGFAKARAVRQRTAAALRRRKARYEQAERDLAALQARVDEVVAIMEKSILPRQQDLATRLKGGE